MIVKRDRRLAELNANYTAMCEENLRLERELAEARREADTMRPVVEAADRYERIYSDPAFDPETASGADWHAEGNALRLLRGEVRSYAQKRKMKESRA